MTRLFLSLILIFAPGFAGAQSFPTKTVTVIIGVAPGGTLDTLARQRVEKQLASEIPPPGERGPDAFRALLEKDSARVAALVKAIGLKPEN